MDSDLPLLLLVGMAVLAANTAALDGPTIPDPASAWFQKSSLSLVGWDGQDQTPPVISFPHVFPTSLKLGDPPAQVSAYVRDEAGVSMVSALIGNRQILMLDLDCDKRYSGYIGSNLLPGEYSISIVALDRAGNAARNEDLRISLHDPSDLNGNRIEDSLERLGSRDERVIVMHDRNLSWQRPSASEEGSFVVIEGSSMVLSGDEIRELARQKGVNGVYKDQVLKVLTSPGSGLQSSTRPRGDGGAGQGVTVALLDTGVDCRHISLDDMDDDPSTDDPKVIAFVDMVNGLAAPYDDNGHGTHCASLISGTGGIGVAPGTRLVVVKIMDRDGACHLSDALRALDWCLENRDRYGIEVISFSVGGEAPSDGRSLLDEACNHMVEQGILVCVAAGNSGPAVSSIVIPGSAEQVITVGAIDCMGRIYDQSSRGPTMDDRVKPDLVTLGVDVSSALAGTRDGESSVSGTSMAVPQVAGALASILARYPETGHEYLTDIKRVLICSTDDLGISGPDNTFGYGALNLTAALDNMDDPPASMRRPRLEIMIMQASGRVGEPVHLEARASTGVRGMEAHIIGGEGELDIPMDDFDKNGIYRAVWETSFSTPGDYTLEVELQGAFGERISDSRSFRLLPRR